MRVHNMYKITDGPSMARAVLHTILILYERKKKNDDDDDDLRPSKK